MKIDEITKSFSLICREKQNECVKWFPHKHNTVQRGKRERAYVCLLVDGCSLGSVVVVLVVLLGLCTIVYIHT